jgi:hypothetical protein
MSFAKVLEELPAFSVEQRQLLIRRALELEETPLSPSEEKIVEARLAAHRKAPSSSLPLNEFKARLDRRSGK